MFSQIYTCISMKNINVISTAHKSVLNFENKSWVGNDTHRCLIYLWDTDSVQLTDIVSYTRGISRKYKEIICRGWTL